MSWASSLSGDAWGHWLQAIAGGGKVSPGERLHPFGTSWRCLSSPQARVWLPAIYAGTPIKGAQHRNDQAIVDLRSANLVIASDPPVLSTLGTAVLDEWKNLPESWEYELPLAIALLQKALLANDPIFRGMLAFWWDVRQKFDEADLLADAEILLLLPYLNRTVAGFNPWVALRDAPETLDLPVPWDELEAAAPTPSAATTDALRKLRGRLDPSRMKAVQVFCSAMSLLFLRREDPKALSALLDSLKLPHKMEKNASATAANH